MSSPFSLHTITTLTVLVHAAVLTYLFIFSIHLTFKEFIYHTSFVSCSVNLLVSYHSACYLNVFHLGQFNDNDRNVEMKMSTLYKRYFFCSVVLILIICAVLYLLCGRGSDEFISVSYVLDQDDDISPSKHIDWKENELLNLTDFQYTIQPKDTVCDSSSKELFGK